jgi:hypothetical protein
MSRVLQQVGLTLGLIIVAAAPLVVDAQAVRRGGGAAGFTASALPANDDESTGLVSIGFGINFFGTNATQLYVNNNGNVTLNTPLETFTPFNLTGNTGVPIIAAFFADVDTRGAGSAVTRYGTGTVDGRAAFGATWDGVGYYEARADKLNVFQLILIDRNDTGAGNFDIEFNYDRILWETGDESGGVNGFGGTSAAVGYSGGSGSAGTFAQLPGSLVNGALLDGGPAGTSLVRNSLNSGVLGRYVLNVRAGTVTVPPVVGVVPEPATVALVGVGVLAVGGIARRRGAAAA